MRETEEPSLFEYVEKPFLQSMWDSFPKTNSILIGYLQELVSGALNGLLSVRQVVAFMKKLSGCQYADLRDDLLTSHDVKVSKVLEKTALGIKYDPLIPKNNNGRNPILSDLDCQIFKKLVNDAADDANCLSTCNARTIVAQLNKNRLKKAKYMLNCAGCTKLAAKVKRIKDPADSWLKKFCGQHGIKVANSQELEFARRNHCDVQSISRFFDRHSELLNRDPRLIFNMDETMVTSRKKFKVLTRSGKLPLNVSQSKFPHITACICYSASGHMTVPLLILPNRAKLMDLQEFSNYFHFASTYSGWMNHDIFLIWCILFVSQISVYRLTLPEEIRNKKILLIVDGHTSRGNYTASKFLSLFGIELLILPGHTSHVLQPFDVGIGAILKCAFKKFLLNYRLKVEDEEIAMVNISNLKTKEIRNMMIICFKKAIDEVCTTYNLIRSFRDTGIVPLNKEKPLASNYTFNEGLYEEVRETFLNNRCINFDSNSLRLLFHYQFKHFGTAEELELKMEKIKEMVPKLHQAPLTNGRLLTKIPDIFIEHDDIIERIHLEGKK